MAHTMTRRSLRQRLRSNTTTAWRACCTKIKKTRYGAQARKQTHGKQRYPGAFRFIDRAEWLVANGARPGKAISSANGANGGNGAKNGATNGAKRGAASPLQQRAVDRDFRDVLTKGLAACRRKLVVVAVFSLCANLLILSLPIYLFQLSDRVYSSRSVDTLIMLSIVVIAAVAAHVFLDMMRRLILTRVAVETESKLGAPVLSAAAKASQSGTNREFQTLGDLQQLRSFITGGVILMMLDAPVAPFYLLAVFLIHPHLGAIVTATGIALVVVALVNQKLTAVPFAQANTYATRANLAADAMARNSQVINAMGMIPEGVQIWGRETAESLKAQVTAQDRNTCGHFQVCAAFYAGGHSRLGRLARSA
jgi:ATP-binding cassette, subfamily C, bacterial